MMMVMTMMTMVVMMLIMMMMINLGIVIPALLNSLTENCKSWMLSPSLWQSWPHL